MNKFITVAAAASLFVTSSVMAAGTTGVNQAVLIESDHYQIIHDPAPIYNNPELNIRKRFIKDNQRSVTVAGDDVTIVEKFNLVPNVPIQYIQEDLTENVKITWSYPGIQCESGKIPAPVVNISVIIQVLDSDYQRVNSWVDTNAECLTHAEAQAYDADIYVELERLVVNMDDLPNGHYTSTLVVPYSEIYDDSLTAVVPVPCPTASQVIHTLVMANLGAQEASSLANNIMSNAEATGCVYSYDDYSRISQAIDEIGS